MRVPSRSPGQQPGSPASPTAPARRRPSGATPRRVPAPAPDLAAYRAAVAELLVEVGALADAASTRARQVLIDERLREPALAAVLDATPQGLIGARETLLLEMARYQPNERTSARDLPALVRIYLLSRIDVLWWQDAPPFVTDDQVNGSADLVDLEWLRRRDLLRFRYQEQARHHAGPGRARAAPPLSTRPHPAHRGAAVPPCPRARWWRCSTNRRRSSPPLAPPATPPLWVTSLARSVEHQYRLRRLGYAAMLPSAHCLGYAVDVEMAWFRAVRRAGTCGACCSTGSEAGEVNVIDEGQAWHMCVPPAAGVPAPGVRGRDGRSEPVCGIALIIGPEADPATFRRMLDRARPARRGQRDPVTRARLLAGTRRLRIVDRERAVQPWRLADGRLAALLQRRDLQLPASCARELTRLGQAFRTESDTEVVLEAFLQWGEAAVDQLRGEYAFAIVERPPAGPTWPATRSGSSRCTGPAGPAGCT